MVKRIIRIAVCHILTASLLCIQAYAMDAQSGLSGKTGEQIRRFFAGPEYLSGPSPGREPLYARKLMERFYGKRDFLPAWSGDGGLSDNSGVLIETIDGISKHGLFSENYHIEKIHYLTRQVTSVDERGTQHDPVVLAELDLLLTDAFFMLGCHFSAGCINPVTIKTDWFAAPDDFDIGLVLENALKENNIREALEDLLPSQPGYARLKDGLARYRETTLAGGWPLVDGGMILHRGDEQDRVVNVRERLLASGDMEAGAPDGLKLFDEDLEAAVMRFQRRHGLKSDGIIGPRTIRAMNVTAGERVRQIEINMERMRWSSRKLGHRYIIVNIADFTLAVIEHGHTVMSMEVVVGKPYWYTPVMSETMTEIILNPSWNIPPRITREEILPRVREAPGYLKEQNIKVVDGLKDDAVIIDPDTIKWPEITADSFPYRFRQEPGPLNPLGSIKFMFPNRFNVYLHDTPAKELFSSSVRSFSHGCIRVSRALDLAEYLMAGDADWTRGKILSGIKSGVVQKIRLPQPINVHVLYLTAWVDEEGTMQFRRDIYGRDRRMYTALDESRQTSYNE